MWTIIATWAMASNGIKKAGEMLGANACAADAIEVAIRDVEDNPFYKSVGYGGLPNEEMEVECDAAFMNGDTLEFGAVGAIKNVANPVCVARSLAQGDANNLLVGDGAAKYAEKAGFEKRNMLTDRARAYYAKRVREEGGLDLTAQRVLAEPEAEQETERGAMSIAEDGTNPCGHDTVGMVCLDSQGTMTAATSTSGLFMKKPGRVGDSPVPGAGFYVDSAWGGAASTGLGEDVMKGCVGYEIVRLMGTGMHPQQACEQAITEFDRRLKERRGHAGDISFVACDSQGQWGAASNIEGFSFVVATQDSEPTVYLCHPQEDGVCVNTPADEAWITEYFESRRRPVE